MADHLSLPLWEGKVLKLELNIVGIKQGNEFSKLSEAQQDELRSWRSSAKGKAHIQKAKEEYQSKKRKAGGKSNEQQGRWNKQKTVQEAKKMIAAAMKTAEEENNAGGDKDKTIAELSSTVVQLREEGKAAAASSVTFSPQTEAEQRKAMCAQLSSIVGRAGKKKKGNQ